MRHSTFRFLAGIVFASILFGCAAPVAPPPEPDPVAAADAGGGAAAACVEAGLC